MSNSPIMGGPIRHARTTSRSNSTSKDVRSYKYIFTWNNYPEDYRDQLENNIGDIKWLICAEEVAPSTGTKHLQGYVEFKGKRRWDALKKLNFGETHVHWQPAKGNPKDQWEYITKTLEGDEDDWGDEFFEIGIRPSFGLSSKQMKQRQSNAEKNEQRWIDAREAAKEGRFDDIPPQLYIPHMRTWKALHQEEKNKVTPLTNFNLRPWQEKVKELVEGPVDDRKIFWYWESTGNVGKSWMGTYLLRNHNATVISNGKTADIAYLLNAPTLVVFDISREGIEHVNYGVMENIKDGRIFSPKYESTIKFFEKPHLIVFANEPCPHGKFSEDRIKSINLTEYIEELELRRRLFEPIPRPVLKRTDPIVAIGDDSVDYTELDNMFRPITPPTITSLFGKSIWTPTEQDQISPEENREQIKDWINEYEPIDSTTAPHPMGSYADNFNIN